MIKESCFPNFFLNFLLSLKLKPTSLERLLEKCRSPWLRTGMAWTREEMEQKVAKRQDLLPGGG